MLRTNEIKSIMRKLRDNSNSVEDDQKVKNESIIPKVVNEAEETDTENDASESDLLLARLEDIISRFEKALAIVDKEDEEAPTEEEPTEDEEAPAEEEPAEEEGAEESYQRSLEDRLAALERRFTESRRRKACRKFNR